MSILPLSHQRAFATLRRLGRARIPEERCELCSDALASDHEHLVEPSCSRMLCCCDACAILFSGQQNARYRRVPRQIQFLPGFRLTDALWDSFQIPIQLAFFYQSTRAGKVVAIYPSPAGAMESLLSLEAWAPLMRDNPMLHALESDVEALMTNRLETQRDCYRMPIDECSKLIGLIRTHWQGITGGTEVREVIRQFFTRAQEQGVWCGEPDVRNENTTKPA